MDIKGEIFDRFRDKLLQNDHVSDSLVNEIYSILKENEVIAEAKLLEIINLEGESKNEN